MPHSAITGNLTASFIRDVFTTGDLIALFTTPGDILIFSTLNLCDVCLADRVLNDILTRTHLRLTLLLNTVENMPVSSKHTAAPRSVNLYRYAYYGHTNINMEEKINMGTRFLSNLLYLKDVENEYLFSFVHKYT